MNRTIGCGLSAACAVMLASAGPAAAGGFAGFSAPTRLVSGPGPSDVQAADLDGDQRTDLAVLHQGDGSIVTLRGVGDGTFEAIGSRQTLSAAKSMALVDLNGDQRPDAAVVSASRTTLAVHMNLGNGTFGAPLMINLSAAADDVVSGDFNGDGHADLAVSHINALSVTVLANDGLGNLRFTESLSVPYYPWSISAGDVDGDGFDDLGVGLLSGGQANMIRIYRSNRQGGFLAPVDTPIARQPVDLAFGDFDQDRVLDCATVDKHAGVATTLRGTGDGRFGEPRFHAFNGQPEELVVVDVNRDGRADVVAAHSYFHRITTIISRGDGTFSQPFWQDVGPQAMDIAHGDFDGDTFPDIVVGHSLPGSTHVSTLVNLALPGEPAQLLDVQAAAGRIIFGPVEDIRYPDSVTLRARAESGSTHFAHEQIDLRITARTERTEGKQLNVSVLSMTNQYASLGQLRLLNRQTGRFDSILLYPLAADPRLESALAVPAGPYIAPDGAIEASLRIATAANTPRQPLELVLDWIELAVE